MNALIRVGSLVALLFAASAGSANPWANPLTCKPYPTAPDACGPGFYVVGPCGMVYGPNYCLYPGFPPYNGERPALPPADSRHEKQPSDPRG